MNELNFNVTTPVVLIPESKDLQYLVNCIVNGISLKNALSSLIQKQCPVIKNLSVGGIEDEQKILDWLRPFVLKEKENVKQKLMEEIEHLEFMAENVSDDLKKSKDELMKLENLEI